MTSNLRQMEAFVTVCAEGSVTKAAAKMALTQSAVSVLVKQFEDAYGTRLFDRQTRVLRPTPLAREMLPVAERILADVAAFEDRLKTRAERERGIVEIAVTPTIGTTIVPMVLEAFSDRYPDIRVHVHDVNPPDVLVLVESGSAAFGMGTFDLRSDFDRLPLVAYSLVLVGRSNALPTRRSTIGWGDLATLPIVSIGKGNTIRSWIDESFEAVGRKFEPAWEVAQFASAIAMVEHGLGYTILPSYLRYNYQSMGLATIDLVKPRTLRELAIVSRRNTIHPPATLALIDMFQETLGRS
jgi:LysR family carnitine catabolism transcriptional activator